MSGAAVRPRNVSQLLGESVKASRTSRASVAIVNVQNVPSTQRCKLLKSNKCVDGVSRQYFFKITQMHPPPRP
jgi:hypothetical protein